MFRKLYNIPMWIIPGIKLLLELTKDSRIVVMVVAIGGFGYYAMAEVDKKHAQALSRIQAQEVKINSIQEESGKILISLAKISKSIMYVEHSVKTTEKRVWDITKDMYLIKQQAK